jgi:uncharacterized protein (TIGR02231 family)
MKKLNLSIAFFAIFFVSTVFSQSLTTSKITDVKVFRNNAQLTNKASANLKAGTSEIVIGNISTSIIPTSIQVSIASNSTVTLLSAKYEPNYLNTTDANPVLKKLNDSLVYLNNELRWVKDQKNIYLGMEDILQKNKNLSGAEGGFKPADLTLLLSTFQNNLTSIKKSIIELDKKEQDLFEKRNRIQNQINEKSQLSNNPSGQIVLQIDAKQTANADFKINYLVHSVSWQPIYDLRSEGVGKPINLAYKAQVSQRSGIDWEKVNLTISTGNPSQNNNQPIFNTQWVDIYQPQTLRNYAAAPRAVQAERNEDVMLESVTISDSRSTRKASYDQGYAYDAVVVENVMSADFVISNPQTILTDGKTNLIGLETYQLPTKYHYQSIPRLDKGAYLLAYTTDWGQYNLIAGTANIFFEGAYVGQSYINPNVPNDSLAISMGKDDGVIIKRNAVKDLSSTKMIGSNKTQVFTYEIEIKNAKKTNIDIEIVDQIPVSKNKLIEIKLEEAGGAKLDETTGKLSWKMNLVGNESKKLKFSYSVKSPKDVSVAGL